MHNKSYNDVSLEDLPLISAHIFNIIKEKFKDSNNVVLHVIGDMGAGKTALIKQLGKSLGIKTELNSPTFTIMREYDVSSDIKQNKLLHIDAYRFESKDEGNILNLKHRMRESSIERPIIAIEWPDNMHSPEAHITINIEKVKSYEDDDSSLRNIHVYTK